MRWNCRVLELVRERKGVLRDDERGGTMGASMEDSRDSREGERGEEGPALTRDCSPPDTVVRLTAGVPYSSEAAERGIERVVGGADRGAIMSLWLRELRGRLEGVVGSRRSKEVERVSNC